MRKEVEGLRTIAAEAVEEAERGLVKAERLLKDDANAAVLRVREEEEAKQGGAAAIAGLLRGRTRGCQQCQEHARSGTRACPRSIAP